MCYNSDKNRQLNKHVSLVLMIQTTQFGGVSTGLRNLVMDVQWILLALNYDEGTDCTPVMQGGGGGKIMMN